MKHIAIIGPLSLAAAMAVSGCATPEKGSGSSWTAGIPFVRHLGGGAEKPAETQVAKSDPVAPQVEVPPVVEAPVVEAPPAVETPPVDQAIAKSEPAEQPGRFAKLVGWFGKDDKAKPKDQGKLPPVTPKESAGGAGKAPPPQGKNSSPSLFVSTAQLYERHGDFASADAQYKKALASDPNHLDALLGYARLLDRQGKFPEATQAYQDAGRRHPQEAGVFNDLALCLARQGRAEESIAAINRAIELRPDRKLYRNNSAKLLVDIGNVDQAFAQLAAVHSPAEAHYNLGYLLTQKGDNAAAANQFARTLELAPQMAEARQWLDILQPQLPPPAQQTPVPPPPSFRDAPAPNRTPSAAPAAQQPQGGPQLGPAAYFPPRRY